MFVLRILLIVATVFFLSSPGGAETAVKEGAKEVGQGLKTMGVQTGKAIKDGGKEVGQGVKKIGQGTGEVMTEKGREVAREAKKVGRTAEREVKKTGQAMADWVRDAYQKTVKTMMRMGDHIRGYFEGK